MLTMVITTDCMMHDSCEKSFGGLSEIGTFQPEELYKFEMYQLWNESSTFLSDDKRELCSSWPPSDNCCCIGRYDHYDADNSMNQTNDYAYCIMGYHKTTSPLLKDGFLTTSFLDARKTSFLEDGEKVDDTRNRENLLEEMASADLTSYCVDPNEIFCNERFNKLGFAASESRNTSVTSNVLSDFSNVNYSGKFSYEEFYSDSDGDELPSSSQPSEEEVDEIDVVSVSRSKDVAQITSQPQFSYESCILPATPLMSERVAALHNYSTRPAPCSRVPVQRVASAPHSPSDRTVSLVTKRSMSAPSSPACRRNNRRKKNRAGGANEKQKGRSKHFTKPNIDHNKRALHNKLEQTRRLVLTELYHKLRGVIPAVRDNARASKSDILTNGRLHIKKLQQVEFDLEIAYKKELRIQEKLENALAAMKTSVYRKSSTM